MKHIVLARRSRRLLAALIDLLLLIISTVIIFLTVVMPSTLDVTKYQNNGYEVARLYKESGLFLTQENGSYTCKGNLTKQITRVSDLNDATLLALDVNFREQNLSKDLYMFYTTKYTQYGKQYNLTKDVYYSEVLKVGSNESNIASIDETTYEIIMIDETKEGVTYDYFINQYIAAGTFVDSFKGIKNLKDENTNMMMSSIFFIIPVLVAFGAIFDLLIPACTANRRTIGKMIFKLDVIGKDGYQLKRINLIPRFLVYIFVEVILGFASFGGLFLISYTVFLFSKNRRALHDFAAKSAVIDAKQSVYFLTKEEEEYVLSRSKNNVQRY